MWTLHSAALRSREQMQPQPALCPTARNKKPQTHGAPKAIPEGFVTSWHPTEDACDFAWGAGIKNIKKWKHPCVSSPCQVCWQFRDDTKGWDGGRGIKQEYERGMTRDQRKREIKQLFEAKSHLSSVATQSELQWNRGTSLSPHQCQKAPLAVRYCHLYWWYIPSRSILRSQ